MTQTNNVKLEIMCGGVPLKQIFHEGRTFVEAPLSGEYALHLTTPNLFNVSAQAGRLLAVVSVDGLNVINGSPASYGGPGYILTPGQPLKISGWRRTADKVAGFEFKSDEEGYAPQMGHGTKNIGAIGVAIFEEKIVRTPQTVLYSYTPVMRSAPTRGGLGESDLGRSLDLDMKSERAVEAGPRLGGAAPAACEYPEEYGNAVCGSVNPTHSDYSPSRGLSRGLSRNVATGYGAEKTMYTAEDKFERRSNFPREVIQVTYATRSKLVEWGVPVSQAIPKPEAFPLSSMGCAAPPNWRGGLR